MGGTALVFTSWSAKESTNDLPTNNFECFDTTTQESFDQGIHGFNKAEVSFGGDWDAGANFCDDPPGLYPRDDLATVTFYVNRNDATTWLFPYLRVRGVSNGGQIDNLVTFTVESAMSQGPYTRPTGSVT